MDKGLFSGMDFYNSAALKYPLAQDVYFMFPTAYYHYHPHVAHKSGKPYVHAGNDGPMDVQFAASRDGIHWNRLDRGPFILLGKTGDWEGGCIYMASGCVVHNNEIWLYYAAADFTHGNYSVSEDGFKGTISRTVLRMDGFVSIDTDYTGGEFSTPPMVFKEDLLTFNVETSAEGHVLVELQDGEGKPIPGFTAEDCEAVNGNFIRKAVVWHGKPDVGELSGKLVKVRFIMRDAKLYAFQFIPAKPMASYGRHG